MNKTKTIISLASIAVFLMGATYIMTIPSDKYDTPRIQGAESALPSASSPSTAGSTQTTTKAPTTTPKATTPTKSTTSTSSASGSSSSSSSSGSTTTTKDTYSAAEVRQHASSSSCWSIVAGGVYDLTSWISRHPGGSGAIKSMCGIDATAEFADQHGGQRQAEQVLSGYKIGFLQ